MKFVQLAKSLQEGIAPVYLIEGEEIYFRDHAVDAVRAACGITQPLFNDSREEGETLKGERLTAFKDGLYTLPFFDEKRLVRAYEFTPSEREWESVMKGYCENPCPSTVLLIVNSKTGACDLKRKKGIVYVDCSKADEDTLSRWLFALMRREGLTADSDACSEMVNACARDAARMKKETEKLKLILGEGGRVTRAAVEEHVERDAEYKIYELTQAASRGNFPSFSEILSDLLTKGLDENAVLSSLVGHFKTLTEISNMPGTDAQIGEILKIKPYAVKKNREIMQNLGKERTEELFQSLYALSCSARSGRLTKSGALSSAVAKIFFS